MAIITLRGGMRGRSITRVRQFVASTFCRPDPGVDREIRRLLNDDRQWQLVRRLSAFDRRHLLAVHNRLLQAGFTDPDLLRAALLHDIGKCDGRCRVTTAHRIIRVLARRLPVPIRDRIIARLTLSPGFYLAEHHARLGAETARELGVSERCCWLIARHECSIRNVNDAQLAALIAADEGATIR